MKKERILITGATGFVGKNFIKFILKKEKKIEIITVNRNINKAKNFFKDERVINIDLNEADIEKIIFDLKPSIVIHLAAYLTSNRDNKDLKKLINSNIEFPTKLLNSFKKGELEYFFNFGTFAEYSKGIKEINNAYLYSATKTAFKSILDFYSETLEFKYFNLIPYSIYGGEDSQKKVMDYIIDSLNSSQKIKMSSGEQILDFIYIDDICEYIYRIIKNKEKIPNKEELFLGTGVGTNIKELSKIIENIYKKTANIEWNALKERENTIKFAIASISKNLLYLDWSPRINLNQGVNKLYEKNRS